MGGGRFRDFLNVIHDDLPSLTRAGDYRVKVGRALRTFVDRHGIAVIFTSDSNIQRRVRWKGSGMVFETFDQIDALPNRFDVVDFTELEKLFALKGTQGRGVEEDFRRRGRRGHHGGVIDKGEDERVWEKVEGDKFNIEITWLWLVPSQHVSRASLIGMVRNKSISHEFSACAEGNRQEIE